MRESAHGFSVSRTVVSRAIGLLGDVLDELDDPARWCKGAIAADAGGVPLVGIDVVELVERPDVAARCVFGHALHQARRRRWRVELAIVPESPVVLELRAPDSFLVAALGLAEGALVLVEREGFFEGLDESPKPRREQPKLSRILLASIVANDLPETTYTDAVWMVVYGIEWLHTQLAQAEEER
jgi:hypothetical protein